MNDKELLTPDERAEVMNALNNFFEEKGINLEVASYEDSDGHFFKIDFWKRIPNKGVMENDG